MLRPKKNSYKQFDNEKKFLRLKNSPPFPFTTISNDAQQMDQKTNVMATNGARASFFSSFLTTTTVTQVTGTSERIPVF